MAKEKDKHKNKKKINYRVINLTIRLYDRFQRC